MLSVSDTENDHYENLRREPRFLTNGKGQVTVLGASMYGTYAATIVDVSCSGLQVELHTPLQKGGQIKVEFSGLTIIGEVQNVRSHDSGHYRMGVFITKMAESH